MNPFRCICTARARWTQRYCPACGRPRNRALWPLTLAAGTVLLCAAGLLISQNPEPIRDTAKPVSSHGMPSAAAPNAASKAHPPIPGHPTTTAATKHPTLQEVERLLAQPGDGVRALEQAVTLLDQLLKDHPNFDYALRLKANLARDLHREAEAIAAYRTFLARNPSDGRTQLNLAELLLQQPDPQEGIQLLKTLVARYPTYAEAHDRLAKGYRLLNDPAQAEHHQNLAKTHQPTQQKPPTLTLPTQP